MIVIAKKIFCELFGHKIKNAVVYYDVPSRFFPLRVDVAMCMRCQKIAKVINMPEGAKDA